MHSAGQNDRGPFRNNLGLGPEISNNNHIAIIARQALAQGRPPHLILILGLANLVQMSLAISVGVRVTVRDVHLVVFVPEVQLEREGVVGGGGGGLDAGGLRAWQVKKFGACVLVLVVGYVFTGTVPAHLVRFCFFLRVNQRLHPRVERRVWLHKVQQVKLVLSELFCVRYFEIKPLCVVVCVVIRLHNKIILVFVDLDCTTQVARFESTFKNKSIVRNMVLNLVIRV